LKNLPPPLAELRKALKHVKGEVDKDAAVVAALVLYKTLMKNAGRIGSGLGGTSGRGVWLRSRCSL